MLSEKMYLYRIVRFDHAVQILKGKLYFSHPSQWEDPYETHIEHDYDHAIFAQCWTTASMSDAMWRIYSPNFLGVRLRTKAGALVQVMRDYTSKNKGFKRRLEKVSYLGQPKYHIATNKIKACIANSGLDGPSLGADLLCVKRSAFKHENEVRAIIYDPHAKREKGGALKGILVDANGMELIESILLDPRAPDEICHAMRHYLKEVLGFPGEVRKSKLYTLKSKS